jgi:AcrR family transcriptional regulator
VANKSEKSRKRSKSANTRLQQITQVAASLFFKKGYWRTTTKEIAEACGISVGTLYYYIKSKDDFPRMFSKIQTTDVGKWEREVRKDMDNTDPEELLRQAVRKYIYLVDLREKLVHFWYNIAPYLELAQLEAIVNTVLRVIATFKDILDMGVEKGQFKTCDTLLAAINIDMMCISWVLRGWNLYPAYTFEQYAATCEQFAVLIARNSDNLQIPSSVKVGKIEAEDLKEIWDRERQKRPGGLGSEAWLRPDTKGKPTT